MSFLEEIQRKPVHIRKRLLILFVAVSGLCIALLWAGSIVSALRTSSLLGEQNTQSPQKNVQGSAAQTQSQAPSKSQVSTPTPQSSPRTRPSILD